MKVATKQKIEDILTNELSEYVSPYEITNTASKMDNGFDSSSKIDATKLDEALNLANKYLNSISLPTFAMATLPIYKNQVLIALGKVKSAF